MSTPSETPPLTLWLQFHGDAPECETGPVADSDVTWCRDKIFHRDTEYGHAGEIRRALAGHPCSPLFGETGLLAATMRVLDYAATLEDASRLTLSENAHLADGDTCTLHRLKSALRPPLP